MRLCFRPYCTDHPACRSKSGWRMPDGMDDRAVNYLFKTPGGSCITAATPTTLTTMQNMVMSIDRRGFRFIRRKSAWYHRQNASADMLRMGEALNAKVVIPFTTISGQTSRPIRKRSACCGSEKRSPEVWLQAVYLAGWRQITWPLDKDNFEYHYPRGFDDASLLNRICRSSHSCNLSFIPIAWSSSRYPA